jgi:putative ATP-dependent endonuclease of OLD family
MFRRSGAISKVLYVKQTFSVNIPDTPGLLAFCGKYPTKFFYDAGSSTFSVRGKIEEDEYRELLKAYQDKKEVHQDIRKIKDLSQTYLSDGELCDLETFAKRIRGEVLFARAWLLCEGQSEYLLIRYFAELLGYLDASVLAVIDFQNNGSPGAFGWRQVFKIHAYDL